MSVRNCGCVDGLCVCRPGGQSLLLMPGGCPSFASGAKAEVNRWSRSDFDALITFLTFLSSAVSFLPVLNAAVAAIPLTLQILRGDCDAAETLKSSSKSAVVGIDVILFVGTLSTVALAFGLVTIPEAAILGSVLLLLAAVRPVFVALGEGRAPTFGELASLGLLAEKSDTPEVASAGRAFKETAKHAKNNPNLVPSSLKDRANKAVAGMTPEQLKILLQFVYSQVREAKFAKRRTTPNPSKFTQAGPAATIEMKRFLTLRDLGAGFPMFRVGFTSPFGFPLNVGKVAEFWKGRGETAIPGVTFAVDAALASSSGQANLPPQLPQGGGGTGTVPPGDRSPVTSNTALLIGLAIAAKVLLFR